MHQVQIALMQQFVCKFQSVSCENVKTILIQIMIIIKLFYKTIHDNFGV